MSYCRFSSDNWKSDIYAFTHVDGGYVIHVAACRYVNPDPIPVLPEEAWHTLPPGELTQILEAQQAWRDAATLEPIGLEQDGEQFNVDTAAECVELLNKLSDAGYHVPAFAIKALEEEADDEQ